MNQELDHSQKIILNAALRMAASNLAVIPQKIYDQPLLSCILDDLSDLNFDDPSVCTFIGMFTHQKYSNLTVGSLRDQVASGFSGCSESHVASRWTSNSDEGGLNAVYRRCSRKESLTHLNQLLSYIGGSDLNEGFEIACKSAPTYPGGSEYNKVRYSLCVNFTWDSDAENRTYTEDITYQSTNLLQLLDESRYALETFLIQHMEMCDMVEGHIEINHIGVCLNEIEVLEFPIKKFIENMYYDNFALRSTLFEAKSLTGVENFAEILLNGNLFKSPACYDFKQRLKGKALEYELGM